MKQMAAQLWSEFRPTILFLVRFVGLYFVLNLGYGWYVTFFAPGVDPLTEWVTLQTSDVLQTLGWENEAHNHPRKPTTFLTHNGKGVVAIYEGCNGLNVAIVFVSFLAALGPYKRTLCWFVPIGLAVIHAGNITRIALLFYVSLRLPGYLYFTHKYLFTAFLYALVMALWGLWLWMNRPQRT
jgi:exosortase family protein XrtF